MSLFHLKLLTVSLGVLRQKVDSIGLFILMPTKEGNIKLLKIEKRNKCFLKTESK